MMVILMKKQVCFYDAREGERGERCKPQSSGWGASSVRQLLGPSVTRCLSWCLRGRRAAVKALDGVWRVTRAVGDARQPTEHDRWERIPRGTAPRCPSRPCCRRSTLPSPSMCTKLFAAPCQPNRMKGCDRAPCHSSIAARHPFLSVEPVTPFHPDPKT